MGMELGEVRNDHRDGLLSPYLRRHRVEVSIPYLRGSVLDYGCATGTLAEHVAADSYFGLDRDEDSLETARNNHPSHRFGTVDDVDNEEYDTIAALAVIEHLPDPEAFMTWCEERLRSGGHLLITTGIPQTDWLHDIGSKMGLLSREVHEEHVSIMNAKGLAGLATDKLSLVEQKYFLFGVNHLAVFRLGG